MEAWEGGKDGEMNNLEEQADNAKARELFWKPLSWLGAIRPTSANDAFDPALWETFVSTTLGLDHAGWSPGPWLCVSVACEAGAAPRNACLRSADAGP